MRTTQASLLLLFLLFLLCALAPQSALLGEPEGESALLIQEHSSKIDYPSQGDESLDIAHRGRIYRARVLHPEVVAGPHFSTALFWVGKEGEEPFSGIGGMVSVPTRAQGLSWHSLNKSYFFSEKQGEPESTPKSLSGLLTIDGWDNADWGAGGLLYLYDGEICSVWAWTYTREPDEAKGSYQFCSVNDATQPLPGDWEKRLSPLLEKAEIAADYWPGP